MYLRKTAVFVKYAELGVLLWLNGRFNIYLSSPSMILKFIYDSITVKMTDYIEKNAPPPLPIYI